MERLPDDGYKVPDEPVGIERYGDYTLQWSGWLPAVGASGAYSLGYTAYWLAIKGEDPKSMAASTVTHPPMDVKESDSLPPGGVSNLAFAKQGVKELAAGLKSAARANLIDYIRRRDAERA